MYRTVDNCTIYYLTCSVFVCPMMALMSRNMQLLADCYLNKIINILFYLFRVCLTVYCTKLNCQPRALTQICQNQSTKAATTVVKWVIIKGRNPENQGSQTLGIHCICFSVIIQHAALRDATVFCWPLVQQFNRTSKEEHQQGEFFHLLSSFAGISSITHCFV